MISVHYVDGGYGAVITCDICEQRIKDADMAVALTRRGKDKAELMPVLHCHKGQCHNQAEKNLRGEELFLGWTELQRHLLQIVLNCGSSPKDLQQMIDMDKELGRLP